MNEALVVAGSILRKLRSGSTRVLGVAGQRGFFQEDIRLQLKDRRQETIDFIEFDAWDYSDSGDLVFTLLGSIAEQATSRKVVTQETIKKISKVLIYVGAGALLKTFSGINMSELGQAFKYAEEGVETPVLNLAERARAELGTFFDEGGKGKLAVLVSNLEKADKSQLDSVFNAVRYLSKASTRLCFVVFFDDTHESAAGLLRLCDSLIHLPHVTLSAQVDKVLLRFRLHDIELTEEEKQNVERFLRVMMDLRGLSRETVDRTIRHFRDSLEVIRSTTSPMLYLFVLALKYQYPEAYRLFMENRVEACKAWLDTQPDGLALVESIESADVSYYPDRIGTPRDIRLNQVINEGERLGL